MKTWKSYFTCYYFFLYFVYQSVVGRKTGTGLHLPGHCILGWKRLSAFAGSSVSFSLSFHFILAPGSATMAPADRRPETLGSHPLRLKSILQQIHDEDCPHVPNPPRCKKRAAVALIIRIRPTYPHQAVYDKEKCSSASQSYQECLDSFFSQEWVQEGDAEVLFIKRAARVGDRWTGHIALSGGKREEDDKDDRATSSRETREEIGLDLENEHSLFVGNLPERMVKSPWGETASVALSFPIPLFLINDAD